MRRAYPDELRSDLSRFHGLNLDGLGSDYSIAHAGALIKCLPAESSVARAIDPDSEWTLDRMLTASGVDALRWLVWAKSKDASKKPPRNMPKPIMRPGVKGYGEQAVSRDVDEVKRLLALPRRTAKKAA